MFMKLQNHTFYGISAKNMSIGYVSLIQKRQQSVDDYIAFLLELLRNKKKVSTIIQQKVVLNCTLLKDWVS